MRLAVVDDESVYRNHVAELIYAVYGAENVSCYLYSDGSETVKSFENGFEPSKMVLRSILRFKTENPEYRIFQNGKWRQNAK